MNGLYDSTDNWATGDDFTSTSISIPGAGKFLLAYRAQSSVPGGVQGIPVAITACAYVGSALQLNGQLNNQVIPINRWAWYAYSLVRGQFWASVPFTATHSNAPNVTRSYLRAITYQSTGAAYSALDSFYFSAQPANQPLAASNPPSYTVELLNPTNPTVGNPTRVLFGVFASHRLLVPAGVRNATISVIVQPPKPVVTTATPSVSSLEALGAVAISGTNFETPASGSTVNGSVTINGNLCANPTYDGQRRITCIVPPATFIGVNLPIVVNLAGRSSDPALLFNYVDQCESNTYVNITVNATYTLFNQCFKCPPGTITTPQGGTVCANCTVGTYSYGSGQSRCQSCEPGTYNNLPASTGCSPCPAGTINKLSGQSTCTPCATGTYSATPASVSCLRCPSGYYNGPSSGNTQCFLCPAGQYSDLDILQPIGPVFQPYVSEANPGPCKPAGAGKFVANPGQPSAAVTLCPAGSIAPNFTQSTCYDCAAGYSSGVGKTACYACNNPTPAGADPVTTGLFAALSGQPLCLACPVGTYAASLAASTCTPCEVGRYTSVAGVAACLPCPPGSAAGGNGTIVCSPCDPGTYAPTSGYSACLTCDPGTYQPASGQLGCLDAPPSTALPTVGAYVPSNSSAQYLLCDPGQYQPNTRQSSCSQCDPGQFQPLSGQLSCTDCPANTFQAAPGQPGCTRCAAGTMTVGASTGNLYCTDCDSGRFNAQSALQTTCSRCSPGTYAPSTGLSECSECGPGTAQPNQGRSVCNLCQPGTATNLNRQTTCQPCAPGSVQPSAGAAACNPCPAGQEQPLQGNTTCVPCRPGYVAATSGSPSCAPCPKGTFSSSGGAFECTPCAAGSYGPITGATACVLCAAGSVQPDAGKESCAPCSVPGTYSGYQGQLACSVCPPGSFGNTTGASQCFACSPGSFQDGSSAAPGACTLCPPGSFSAAVGAIGCQQCAAGSAQPDAGTSACVNCEFGKSQSNVGQALCDPCGFGTYAPINGTEVCLECAPGSYSAVEGAQFCLPCAPGSYQDQPRLAACVLCTPGFFSTEGQINCLKCPARTAAPNSGLSSCYACDENAVADANNVRCLCNPDYAAIFVNDNATGITNKVLCQRCPKGAICDAPGTIWNEMRTAPGYWSPIVGTYYQCLLETQCVGGAAVTANANGTVAADAVDSQCASARTGPLCSYCRAGYSTSVGGDCNPCGPRGNSAAYTFFILLIFIGLLVLCLYIIVTSGSKMMDLALEEEEDKIVGLKTMAAVHERHRYGNIITLEGPPPPKPDFTFKLKM